jgi:hypothetical protein
VLADYETQETGTYQLAGRYQTTYTLSTPVASTSYLTNTVTLGTILEPTSPLLNGVSTFAYQGTSAKHLPTSAFNKNNPIVVAQYSDGNPAIVRGQVNGHRVVEINGYGLSATGSSSYGWATASDGAKVFANALLYTIPPLLITTVKSNDFGAVPLFTPSGVYAVVYTNVSTSSQTLTAVSLAGAHIGDFAAIPSAQLPVTIPPGGTFTVNVTFLPSGLGLRAATLSTTIQGAPGPATSLLTGTGN